MKSETLTRVVQQTFDYAHEYASSRLVSFIWHGGEPTIPGVRFYEKVAELQAVHCNGASYNNSLQTNGTLLNDRWLDFLKAHHYTVSVSIDGPAQLHDTYRVDRRGRGTYDRVLDGINRVQDAGIPLGVCVVISRANIGHVDDIYDLLAAQKLRFNVIPLNRSGAARDNYADLGLAADEYADAWIRMYDRWFDATDDEYVYCSDFVFKTRSIMAGRPADCIGLEQCSDTNISIDPIGDVYPCATLSGTPHTRYGNIVDHDLARLMHSSTATAYRHRNTDPQCTRCRWQHVCHGGCQARAFKFFGDHHQRDYYCPSLFRIYEHIAARVSDRFDQPWQRLDPPVDVRVIPITAPAHNQSVALTLMRSRDGRPVNP